MQRRRCELFALHLPDWANQETRNLQGTSREESGKKFGSSKLTNVESCLRCEVSLARSALFLLVEPYLRGQ